MYVRWPLYLTILLVGMCVSIYLISPGGGVVASFFTAVYIMIAAALYLRNRSAIYTELVSFATQYGQIQKTLLKDLAIPYALMGVDGKLIWMNREFMNVTGKGRRYNRSINTIFPELNPGLFPTVEIPDVSVDLQYGDGDYRVEMKLISVDYALEGEELVEDAMDRLIAVYLFDTTEINRCIRENREQRMAAGLVYIDNYDEALENVEDVRTSLLVALIERKINKYFNAYDGIVRKLEKDRFFVVMQEKALAQIRENKFDLLQDIKTVNIGNEMAITLSISIGSGGSTYMDCMEYARSAMDLALARGGDQAEVKTKDQITY